MSLAYVCTINIGFAQLQFSLMSGFYQWVTSRDEVRILIIGLESAGKTTLLEQIKTVYSKGYKPLLTSVIPTIGVNLGKVTVQSVDVTIWDIGGSMRHIWDQYYGEADAIIYVVDASERNRFGECASTLELVLQRPDANRVPIMVVANKKDKKDAAARATEVMDQICKPAGLGSAGPAGSTVANGFGGSSTSSAGQHAAASNRREYRIFEVSALTQEGVRDAVDWLVGAAKSFAQDRESSST